MSTYSDASLILPVAPEKKAGKIYSLKPTDGSGDFDFTRASTATRVNESGLIESVASGVPRLNYPLIDGVVNGCPSLLLEPARTNLITYSEAFDNAYWTKSDSSVVSGFVSPDGTTNAFKLIESATTGGHNIYKSISVTNGVYTFSVVAKNGERDWIFLTDANTGIGKYFNVNTGVKGADVGAVTSSNIEALADGWYRCSFTSTATASTFFPVVYLADADSSFSYTGDGTSGVYIFGAQLEQGSFPTSYIPTNGSTATRSAETCNNAGDVNTFNDSEGVLMVEGSTFNAADNSFRYISLNDGTSSNLVRFVFYLNYIFAETVVGGVNQGTTQYIFPDTESNNKIAFEYGLNNFILWVNGFNVNSDLIGNIFPANTLTKLSFDNGSGVNNFYGNTKQLLYFPSALNDSDLETLTSWDSFSDMATEQLYTIL